MRILVVGGTRFIGPKVIDWLNQGGHDLASFSRGKSPVSAPQGVRRFIGDRREPGALSGAIRAFRPDVVVDMMLVFEEDARMLVNACRGIAERVVAVSSIDVYRNYGGLIGKAEGPADPTPLTEDSPLRGRLYPYQPSEQQGEDHAPNWQDLYDKIPIERHVMSQPDIAGTVVRLPMVYGPGDYQHRLNPILRRVDDGREAIVMDEAEADFKSPRGFVTNVACAVGMAAENPKAAGRTYHVADKVCLTEAEWARAVIEASGKACELLVVPTERLPEDLKSGIDPSYGLDVDSSRIRTELGFEEAVGPDEALRQTIAWERANAPEDAPCPDYALEDEAIAAFRAGG